MNRPSPRDSARHEAAHGIVAWLCGIPLKSCEIRSRPVTSDEKRFVTLGFTRMTDEENDRLNALLHSAAELTEDQLGYLRRHLLFTVAGFVAEQVAGTTSQETLGADRRSALLIAGRLSGGRIIGEGLSARVVDVPGDRKSGALGVLTEAEDDVKKLLEEHEAAWDGLASLLMHHGALTGEQVAQFLAVHSGRHDRQGGIRRPADPPAR